MPNAEKNGGGGGGGGSSHSFMLHATACNRVRFERIVMLGRLKFCLMIASLACTRVGLAGYTLHAHAHVFPCMRCMHAPVLPLIRLSLFVVYSSMQ